MRRALVAFFVCAFLSAPAAFGQIFYEPVKYQYNVGDQTFYYGGSNPHLLDFAYRQARLVDASYYKTSFGRRFQRHEPVWSDLLPYRDMTDVYWNADDAANEANANIPRYFHKRDALMTAHYDVDGTITVPAQGPSMYVRPMVQHVYPRPLLRPWGKTTRPAATNPAKKGEVIIIPKNLLDRPLKDFVKPGKQVASAR